jgi:hypothetical protein
MIKRIPYLIVLLAVITFLQVSPVSADDPPPQWLQEAAKLSTPSYDIKDVSAVVLRSEESVTVESDGTVTTTVRFAVRILVREGRREAVARAVYETDTEKVRDIKAWLIRRSGPSKDYGKKETVDLSLVDNDLYNEARMKLISATDEAAEGDIFGYETVTQGKSIFSQFQFSFQNRLPVLFSQFSLNLPSGWRAESVTFNKAKVEPTVNGSSYVWQVRDLQPINYEAGSPNSSSLSPRLAVSFFPAQATATQFRTFSNWSDVARWMSEIEDPQMTVDDALAAKAHDLTDNLKTELEKIRAISKYVQQVQYISIQIGVGKGGGYRPRPSTEVFAKSYGDCKDKANLMRAMLSVLKIPAYLVSITADDPTYVRAEWASPHQFNHCIIAIKVGEATSAHSIVTHPSLGRLLIFDPTDPYTPVGDLPEEQQGSLALIDHKETDALTQMPILPAEMNRLERSVDVTLGPRGEISGTINEKTVGQSAVAERSRLRGLSAAQYSSLIENWIARGATGAKTSKIDPQDNHQSGDFTLDVEFTANSYAQIMQGRLMVFKPAIIGRLEQLSFTEGTRVHPYLIDATLYSETVKIKLPEGFDVDELPSGTKIETAFGKYDANYSVSGDLLTFTRSLKLNRSTIPADKYDTVRSFFGRVHAAEQSQVVLMKK